MDKSKGLVCAYLLDGKGGGRELDWETVRAWAPAEGPLWVHLDREDPEAQRWLQQEANLDSLICEALLAEETRPRSMVIQDGLVIILRGVNMNPGADPEDMISLRAWIENSRIITLQKPKVMAIEDIRNRLKEGIGPKSPGDFLVQVSHRLIDRMGPVLEEIDEEVDTLEEEILEAPSNELRFKLSNLRRKAISLRRYLSPQREVISHFQLEPLTWLTDRHRAQLREVLDRLVRYVEDLDESRERAAVTQEELAGRISDRMNKTMYMLAIVATVFLPLGLLTGLLGINVGGIPGTDNTYAFLIVCFILVSLAFAELWFFMRRKRF